MTKRELLRFLEPFGDDIEIVIEEDRGCVTEPVPRYLGAHTSTNVDVPNAVGHTVRELAKHGIGRGHGYVLL